MSSKLATNWTVLTWKMTSFPFTMRILHSHQDSFNVSKLNRTAGTPSNADTVKTAIYFILLNFLKEAFDTSNVVRCFQMLIFFWSGLLNPIYRRNFPETNWSTWT